MWNFIQYLGDFHVGLHTILPFIQLEFTFMWDFIQYLEDFHVGIHTILPFVRLEFIWDLVTDHMFLYVSLNIIFW